MSELGDELWRDCAKARALIQEHLDSNPRESSDVSLPTHLEECDACHEYLEGQLAVRAGLRGLPLIAFPEDAIEEVWSETISAGRFRRGEGRPAAGRRWLAAAAVLAAAMVGWPWFTSDTIRHSAERTEPVQTVDATRLARAATEVRLVVDLTNDALDRVERAAFDEPLMGRLAETLRQLRVHRGENETEESEEAI